MSAGINFCSGSGLSPELFENLQRSGLPFVCISSDEDVESFFSGAAFSPKSRDRTIIGHFANDVISGFLNLAKGYGWSEGSDPRIGAAFTRFMVKEYFQKASLSEIENAIIKRVLDTFENVGNFEKSPFSNEPDEGHRPNTSRVRYDAEIYGWQKHAITRMVGNVASSYNPKFPFFEILINSARSSSESEACKPFFITIHGNEKELDQRRVKLASMKMFPAQLAHFTFYSNCLKDPEKFLLTTKLKIGPNSMRILEGLIYLQNKELKAQSVGNCWIKQPMRSLLVGLYLEVLSVKKELTPDGAWKEAVGMYKDIQKKAGIPIIEELLTEIKLTPDMKDSASRALEYRRTF